MAERATFINTKQNSVEGIQSYAQRLRDAARYCEFNKLGAADAKQGAEDELIQMRLIDGMHHNYKRMRILEQLQIVNGAMTLDDCVQFVQQLEMIGEFGCHVEPLTASVESLTTSVSHVDKNRQRYVKSPGNLECGFCGYRHERNKCPAYGKECSYCGMKNHFAKMCKKKKRMHHIEKTQMDEDTNDLRLIYLLLDQTNHNLHRFETYGSITKNYECN